MKIVSRGYFSLHRKQRTAVDSETAHRRPVNMTAGSATDADSSCRPPPGKTYLTIGQDFFSIEGTLFVSRNNCDECDDG